MNDSTPAETDVPLYRPATLAQALALLRDNPDARPLGGGQTLVPMLTLGYAQVSAIIALADIAELHGITRLTDGSVRIGAMTTHAEIAACTTFVGGQSLLSHTAGQIADPAIRSFGTIGGACAHGDTVADWPPSLVAADARVVVAGPGGNREMERSTRASARAWPLRSALVDLRPCDLRLPKRCWSAALSTGCRPKRPARCWRARPIRSVTYGAVPRTASAYCHVSWPKPCWRFCDDERIRSASQR